MHCPQTAFIIWAVAGIVCLIGAYAYAELGTMFPESGGDFQYLRRAYGKKMALVFGWSFIIVLNPIGTAGIAGVLGRYSVDMITYFETGNSVGVGAGGDGGKRIPNGGQREIGPQHSKLLDRFKSRQPLNKSTTAATSNTAMIAKRFLEGGEEGESEADDDSDVYYFYEMDDDDMSLYDKFARQSFWIPDSSLQSPELQQGLAQKDHGINNQSPSDAPSFPKPALPSNNTGDVPPKPGMGPNGNPLLPTFHADNMPIKVRLFSIASIVIMGLINICFKEGGKWASNVLAIFKIAGMMILIGIGTVHAIKTHNQSETLKIPIRECSHNLLDYVSALCFAFFAFNGFNNINLGLGELRNPERNLKRAVLFALPLVTALFLLANFSFFSILSSYDLRHVHSLSLHAGHTVLGQPGGFLMAGTVVAAALGSINANIWAGSRLLVILAKDDTVIPYFFAKIWTRRGTTALALSALVLQASVHAMINLDFKTFSKIYSAVGWWWYGLSIAGLLYLRKQMPDILRPVRIWWPLALIFVMVAFFLVVGALTLAFMSVGYAPSSGSTNGHMSQVSKITRRDGAQPSSAEGGERGASVKSNYLGDTGGNDDDEGEGDLDGTMQGAGSRFIPVIMFAAVAGLMLLIIPAYYGTRALRRRRERLTAKKEAQAEALAAEEPAESLAGELRGPDHDNHTDSDSSDSCCESSSSGDEESEGTNPFSEKFGQESDCYAKIERMYPHQGPALGPIASQERTYDKSRRDSTASSVTLVDERTGKRLHRSHRHHHHHHHREKRQSRREQSGPQPKQSSHNEGLSLNGVNVSIVELTDEGEEQDLVRIKSLRASSLECLCQESLGAGQPEADDGPFSNAHRNGRQMSAMTVFGDLEVVGAGSGSSRNGSTSGSSSVRVATETEGCDPFSSSVAFVPSGPEHPFDHRSNLQPSLLAPGEMFWYSQEVIGTKRRI
ncbi:hypothetical protein EMPS_00371 [Entomortierella parvispora]|uniref:Amino acid permease/ SLC12A domain-containing protein n=1 Tax=Entomortierella parvispora TaxID=205924 RepID=A0A9P3H0P4_9FUNG|nr:hypothetical protein EMPS_00371 [Entomortierella parvispora]